jgi:hypothetical protein
MAFLANIQKMLDRFSMIKFLFAALLLCSLLTPPTLFADGFIEEAGVGVGVVAGNLIYVPMKITTMILALPQGVFSWILSGGNDQLTKQFLDEAMEGPYFITPELARFAIGERPEIPENKP